MVVAVLLLLLVVLDMHRWNCSVQMCGVDGKSGRRRGRCGGKALCCVALCGTMLCCWVESSRMGENEIAMRGEPRPVLTALRLTSPGLAALGLTLLGLAALGLTASGLTASGLTASGPTALGPTT